MGSPVPIVPIDPMVRTVPALQMKYSAYGFPYADLINLNKGNPEITVTGGTVSSLMKDEHGQLVSLKLDGGLHPGNSGGPLVDEQGRLIGVAVAKLHGVDNIGLAIPAADLRAVLAGRVGAMDLIISKSQYPNARPASESPARRPERPDQGGQTAGRAGAGRGQSGPGRGRSAGRRCQVQCPSI